MSLLLDALGSAKGWAASLLLNEGIKAQLNKFISRSDTFSLGVCNGCQLMNLLGWFSVSSQGIALSDISIYFQFRENSAGFYE